MKFYKFCLFAFGIVLSVACNEKRPGAPQVQVDVNKKSTKVNNVDHRKNFELFKADTGLKISKSDRK